LKVLSSRQHVQSTVTVQVAGESSKAKKAEEKAKTAPELPLEKAIVDHFSETLLPGSQQLLIVFEMVHSLLILYDCCLDLC